MLPETSSDIIEQIRHSNDENAHHPLLGMGLVTLAAICYSILNLSVKALMHETPWQEIMFIRMTITWIATMTWIIVKYKCKLNLCGPLNKRILLIIRAIFLWGAMFTCWWSFEFLPVGDATTLQMSFPVWVSIFAHFVWKNDQSQRLDKIGWIFILCGLTGVIFVAQPSFIFGFHTHHDNELSNYRDTGIIIGICSAICAAIQYIIVNYTKTNVHWLQVEQLTAGLSTFILCPIGAIAFALYDYFHNGGIFIIKWSNLSLMRWLEEIALGLLGFCALALLTRGSQLDKPSRTAICLYLKIPFVYIGQSVLLTHSIPNVYVFIGIFLVICSVIIPAIRKGRNVRKTEKYIQHQDYVSSDEETIALIQTDFAAKYG
eukprot:246191_1